MTGRSSEQECPNLRVGGQRKRTVEPLHDRHVTDTSRYGMGTSPDRRMQLRAVNPLTCQVCAYSWVGLIAQGAGGGAVMEWVLLVL